MVCSHPKHSSQRNKNLKNMNYYKVFSSNFWRFNFIICHGHGSIHKARKLEEDASVKLENTYCIAVGIFFNEFTRNKLDLETLQQPLLLLPCRTWLPARAPSRPATIECPPTMLFADADAVPINVQPSGQMPTRLVGVRLTASVIDPYKLSV